MFAVTVITAAIMILTRPDCCVRGIHWQVRTEDLEKSCRSGSTTTSSSFTIRSIIVKIPDILGLIDLI